METTNMEKPNCKKNQHMAIKVGGCGGVSVVVWGGTLAIAALVSFSAMKFRRRRPAVDTHPPPVPASLSDETEQMTNKDEGDKGLPAIIPCDEQSDAGVTQIDSPPLVSTGSLILENKDPIPGNGEMVALSDDFKPEETPLWVENGVKAKEAVFQNPVKAEEATHADQIPAEDKVDSIAPEDDRSTEEEEEEEEDEDEDDDDDENSADDEEEDMVEEKGEESSEGTGESSNAEAIWPEESMQRLSLELGAAKMEGLKLTEKTEGLMEGVSLKLEGVNVDEQKLLEKIEGSMLRLSTELAAARMDDQKVTEMSHEFGAVKMDGQKLTETAELGNQKLTEEMEVYEHVEMEVHGCPNTNEKSSYNVHHSNEKKGPAELPDMRVWIWSLLLLSLVVPLLLLLTYNFYFFEMLP